MGGIGSASVVLALRSTMENVISGLLLKLEDKIRVGEIITVPGDGKKSGTHTALLLKFYIGNITRNNYFYVIFEYHIMGMQLDWHVYFLLCVSVIVSSLFPHVFELLIPQSDLPNIPMVSGCEEGVVEEVNYIATTIRREDNSVVVVPNQVFSKGEIINWSRTPYRLFKTNVAVKMTDCSLLGENFVKMNFMNFSLLGETDCSYF